MRYGSVHHWEDVSATLEKFQNPHKYFPPFTVRFNGLTRDEIKGDILTLNGISEHLDNDGSQGPSYEASCRLNVVERLNYLPSLREIKQ
jgi:hypothetical protein